MTAVLSFLAMPFLGTLLGFWLAFLSVVIVLLVLDLGVLHRRQHEIGMRESLLMYAAYFVVGLLFGAWVWHEMGQRHALEFYTGFLVEQSLSMDNVFVMAMIFGFLGIPRLHQHRVLFWGILGVIVLRALMIGFGTLLVQRFDWVLYVFGAFLLFSGVRMLFSQDEEQTDLSQNRVLAFLRRHLRVSDTLHGGRFFVRQERHGRRVLQATPLFLALVLIELADLVFAVDSVPAVFSITQEPFIVYTSNIFAILGLRSLYFALAALMHRFIYLKYALALVLLFIGGKILLHQLLPIPPAVSLGVTFALLSGGVLASWLRTRRDPPA